MKQSVLLIIICVIFYTLITQDNDVETAMEYCDRIGEELSEVRINEYGNKQYLCSQKQTGRTKRGQWLRIKEIKLQLDFLNAKKKRTEKQT